MTPARILLEPCEGTEPSSPDRGRAVRRHERRPDSDLFQLFDDDVGGRHIEPVRTDEGFHELPLSREHVWRRPLQHRDELRGVLVQRRRGGHQAAGELEQQLEMQRAFMLLTHVFHEDRHHRPVDDGGFDERARRNADDRGAVIERIEVIVPRLLFERVVAEERDVSEAAPVDAFPIADPRRMRPNEDRHIAQPRIR